MFLSPVSFTETLGFLFLKSRRDRGVDSTLEVKHATRIVGRVMVIQGHGENHERQSASPAIRGFGASRFNRDRLCL